MSINLTTEASLDFVTLQKRINEEESAVSVRLTSLTGKTQGDFKFNAHIYTSVDDKGLALSKLFVVPAGEPAANDPIVAAWLAQNSYRKIICEGKAYASDSLEYIAVVR